MRLLATVQAVCRQYAVRVHRPYLCLLWYGGQGAAVTLALLCMTYFLVDGALALRAASMQDAPRRASAMSLRQRRAVRERRWRNA